jgi:DNA-binding NtrC family response regulator
VTRDAPDAGETDLLLERRPTLPLASYELLVVEGPDVGLRHVVQAGTTRIGTATSAHLRLGDRSVSRVHCELVRDGPALRVVDLGSTNGTSIDGVRVRDAELAAGAVLRLGATTIRVETDDEPLHVVLSARDSFGPVLGASTEMRRVYALLERAAPSDATVLITGETGTGKELVARALHDAGPRASGPFVAVDCAAIAESLIEAELFGHVRGAFTGANVDKKGLVELAHGGTLFLDDVGELPPSLQPKLLRVLETRTVRPIGAAAERAVDVRVIAASKQALARGVNEGRFRDDLYFRLAVVEITVPPLRARREDVPMLAAHFYERFTGRETPLPREVVSGLVARAWPGNVRELRNVVERGVALGWTADQGRDPSLPQPSIAADTGEIAVPVHLPLREARIVWTEQFERVYATALLEKTSGNVTRAAAIAGVNRRTFQRMIAQLGLSSDGTSKPT